MSFLEVSLVNRGRREAWVHFKVTYSVSRPSSGSVRRADIGESKGVILEKGGSCSIMNKTWFDWLTTNY